MAIRHRRSLCCELEFAFDRLHAAKLEQVFAILVPNRERRIDESTGLKGESHENSRHLRPCLPSAMLRTGFGSTEGGEDHSQSDGGADRICPPRKLPVPDEWVFEDEGYSGANLIRPGLPRIRDLAAEGQIQAVLALSPDRLSRKYAYQVLLTEELARHGVDRVFMKAPHSGTPEDQLLLQFQGMIAEYERAQILERSRRGKRHRAKQGEVSVLSGAPYGYRYIRKTEETAAYYEIIETEADVVRKVFNGYTVEGLSIGAIARQLTESGLPTRKQKPRWKRSVIWAILRNPAYQGRACFGKTAVTARQRITRPLRLRGGISARNSSNIELPRTEWIEIPVPALVSEETFALAQEKLIYNKLHSPRRTIDPSILQGLVHCRQCSFALYEAQHGRQHAKSTTIVARVPMPIVMAVKPFAIKNPFVRIYSISWFGTKFSVYWRTQHSSRTS